MTFESDAHTARNVVIETQNYRCKVENTTDPLGCFAFALSGNRGAFTPIRVQVVQVAAVLAATSGSRAANVAFGAVS